MSPLRAQIEALRAELRQKLTAHEGGNASCRAFSDAVERVVLQVFLDAVGGDREGLVVMAVGGLARSQLAPRADIDLHFLMDDTNDRELACVESVLYPLWDAGLVLGHGVYTVAQWMEQARADAQLATVMLEARPIAGDIALGARALANFHTQVLPELRDDLLLQKVTELRERRARFGSSGYLTEPNIKSSPGGLRDLHTILWLHLLHEHPGGVTPRREGNTDREAPLATSLLTARTTRIIGELSDTLLAIRSALQLVADRQEDRLLFEHQEAIARMLSISVRPNETESEALMRTYFQAARRGRQLVDDILLDLDAQTQRTTTAHVLPLGEPFVVQGGLLCGVLPSTTGGLLSSPVAPVIDAVRVAEEHHVEISPPLRASCYELLDAANDDAHADSGSAAAILRLAKSTSVQGSPFTRLLTMGVLEKTFADFLRLSGRFKQDGIHAFPTDFHICRCADMALRVVSGTEPTPDPLRAVMERLRRGHLLVLGALFHDIGKGLPGDHSQVGTEIALREASRMGLARDEMEILRFLVADHLVLSKASHRRDLSDPAVVEELARRVRTPERLDLLAALTWVDTASVAPGMFTDWKARLLELAVERVRSFLLEPSEGAFLRGEQEAEVRAAARDALASSAAAQVVATFVEGASVRTLASRLEDELVDDLAAFAQWTAASGPIITVSQAEGGCAHTIRIVCEDRRGLLADLAAALSSHGANVLHANIDAREDGLVVDAFRIDNGEGAAIDERAMSHAVEALRTAGNAGHRASGRVTRSTGRRNGPPVSPQVKAFVGSDTWGATIVEIRGEDRPGLVASLSRVFAGCGWNIVLAKINTEGRVARDTFYVVADARARATSDVKTLEEALSRCLLLMPGKDG